MDTKSYAAHAVVTAPLNLHLDAPPTQGLYGAIRNAVLAGEDIDRVKKALVYGYGLDHEKVAPLAVFKNEFDKLVLGKGVDRAELEKFVHGVIGVASESAELLEALLTVLFGGDEIDKENAKEEVGDLLWYIERICTACGFTVDDARDANIGKLRVRHGDAFNQLAGEEANRDRGAEQAAMAASGDKTLRNYKGDVIDGETEAVGPAPAANLGMASNRELELELRARQRSGHNDPNYRTVDGGLTDNDTSVGVGDGAPRS